jgi:ABC-type multidrug transport system fused ATPase/permease subunit
VIVVFILNALSFIINTLVANPLFVILLPYSYPSILYVFSFYPPFNFSRVFSLVGYEIYLKNLIFTGSTKFSYFQFSKLFQKGLLDTPAPFWSIVHLIWNSLLMLILSWYFDYVLSSNHGARQPFYFCFLPSFWGFSKKTDIKQYIEENAKLSASDLNSKDENVLNELQNVKNLDQEEDEIIRIIELNKTYSSGDQYVNAVKNVSFIAKKGTCFSLLGHNGAGKTVISFV